LFTGFAAGSYGRDDGSTRSKVTKHLIIGHSRTDQDRLLLLQLFLLDDVSYLLVFKVSIQSWETRNDHDRFGFCSFFKREVIATERCSSESISFSYMGA
jgi:hypothetical protein